MDESCEVKLSKTCVKNFQDLPCGREFMDVAVRRSGCSPRSPRHNQPNQIGENDGKQAKQKISRSVQAHERGHCGDPQMSMADMRAVMEHGGDATTEPRGVDYIEAETQRTPGSERPSPLKTPRPCCSNS